MTTVSGPSAGVDLAQEQEFALGGVLVSPSACRVKVAGREQRVEPRVMQVLVVLARHAGHTITRDQLIESCWDGRIVSDDAITRVVAQVRNLARSIEPAPFVLETVPKVGFRLITSGGEVQTDAAPAASTRTGRPRMAIAAVIAALALALAGGLAWWFAAQGPVRVPGQNGRVDVMMFEPRGSDPALQKVSADVSEALVRMLSGAGVQVAERPVRRDAGASEAELRVAGTIERDKADYVINAQILDRKTGLVLWSDRLVRTAQQQEDSPGETAYAIAAILHCALEDRKPARTPVSTEAFGLYLNACAAVFIGYENNGRMLAVTRRLVKAAPQFAGAHAMHSIAAAVSAEEIEQSPTEAAALHAESKAAAEQALKLDPNTPKAYSGLALNEGAFGNRLRQNWFLEEQYLLKALKLDPDLPPARNEYAGLLRSTGRVNQAVENMRTADDKDPRNGGDPRIAMLLAATGDLAGAEAALKALEAATRTSSGSMRWTIAFWWEDPKTALPKIRALDPDFETKEEVGCYVTFLEELEARRARGARGLPANCNTVNSNWRIRMLAREGDVDGAFAALKAPIPGGALVLYYPEMKAVRRDPRFWPLVKSMGLTDYWLKSGRWPDFCAEPDLPYDCRAAARAPG